MIYYIVSIIGLTLGFNILLKSKIIYVCPICAAVVITWMTGLLGLYLNQIWANPLTIAILLGMSAGALVEKFGIRYGLLWKLLMVLLTLPAIYYLVDKNLAPGAGLIFIMVIITIIMNRNQKLISSHSKDLFKECC